MTIVVGLVDSPEGRAALDRAVDEARLRDQPLVVVHSFRGGHEDVDDIIAWRARLDETDKRLTDDGVPHRVVEYVQGNRPAVDILQVASDEGAELIVIGMRNRSRVGKLVLGSTAQEILLDADCAVLAVKAPRDE